MTEEQDLINLEFYKEQYQFEHDRSKFYDKIIQYPTTLVVILIGGVLYSFNRVFGDGFPDDFKTLEWIFTIALCLFAISIIFTGIFLFTVFHGFSRKYFYLPRSKSLAEHENALFKYHYRYSELDSKPEKLTEAKNNTCESSYEIIKQYYIDLTDENQRINDKRADNYYLTRTFLFIDLIIFVLIAVIGFIK